jgi:hypothetical protein
LKAPKLLAPLMSTGHDFSRRQQEERELVGQVIQNFLDPHLRVGVAPAIALNVTLCLLAFARQVARSSSE